MGRLTRIHTAESGGYHCIVCGSPLVWQSDFMRSEIYGPENLSDDDDSVVAYWTCPECGVEHEITSYSNNELEELKAMEEEDGGEGDV